MQLNNKRILINDFIMALAQLTMNFHTKANEFKYFLFVK